MSNYRNNNETIHFPNFYWYGRITNKSDNSEQTEERLLNIASKMKRFNYTDYNCLIGIMQTQHEQIIIVFYHVAMQRKKI